MDSNTFLSISNLVITVLSGIIITYITLRSNNKIEKLKSQLDIQNNKSKVLFEEEKNSIRSFFNSYKIWYDDNKELTNYHHLHIDKLKNLEIILDKSMQNVKNEYSYLELFINDKGLLKVTDELLYSTKQIQDINIKWSYQLIEDYSEINNVVWSIESGNMIAYAQETINHHEKNIELIQSEYLKEFTPLLTNVNGKKEIFLDLAKKYIRKD